MKSKPKVRIKPDEQDVELIISLSQILAGYALSTNATAVIDIVDHSKTYYSGWHPTVQNNLMVHGELSVGLALEMPIRIGVGIDLPIVKWWKVVGAINTPGVHFDASVDIAFEYRTITSPDGTTLVETVPLGDISGSEKCPGVNLGLSLADRFEADVLFVPTKTLWDKTATLVSHCVTLWHSQTASPTCPATASYKYLGCFQDHLGYGGTKRSLSGKTVTRSGGNTIEQCRAACSGYLYYGLGVSQV